MGVLRSDGGSGSGCRGSVSAGGRWRRGAGRPAAAAVGLAVAALTAACSAAGSAQPVTVGPATAASTAPASTSAGASTADVALTGSGRANGPSTSTGTGRPALLVAVRGLTGPRHSGALVLLDPVTGVVRRTLDPALVVGDAVQRAADGTVYYEKAIGCAGEIWTVPVVGGTPHRLLAGSRPALSPDGTRLAFSTAPIRDEDGCTAPLDVKAFGVAVRTLATGRTTVLTLPLELQVIPPPADHLSWSPDGRRLAVSISSPQDNELWGLRLVDPPHDRYYTGSAGQRGAGVDVPAGPQAQGNGPFFREAVYLPGGTLFVVRRCCSGGGEPNVRSEALEIVDPATGALRQHVATGVLTNDHRGLDTDRTGRWLLYLAGDTLMVSHDGGAPVPLTTGIQAADW